MEAFKNVIFRSTKYKPKVELIESGIVLKLKNGLNLENPITNESVNPCSPFFRHPVLFLAC